MFSLAVTFKDLYVRKGNSQVHQSFCRCHILCMMFHVVVEIPSFSKVSERMLIVFDVPSFTILSSQDYILESRM